MEKRWCERFPVSVDVMLYHNGHQLARCGVKDISLCGIRLHSGPLAFCRNTSIRIQFLGEEPQQDEDTLIKAVVVRNANEEIGLVFDPTEPEMLRSIIKNYKMSASKPIDVNH